MDRYLGSQNEEAVNRYCDLAEANGMTGAEMALAWCYHNPLVTSTIGGATTMDQLTENLNAYDIRLSEEVMKYIGELYKVYTDPTKARNS